MPKSKGRNRSPGKKFPSKYEQDVEDRREFRMRMKAELKSLAKDSFLEELERMKQIHPLAMSSNNNNNNSHDAFENDRHQQLEVEVIRLNQMVEELKYSHGNNNNNNSTGVPGMQVEWSSPLAKHQFLNSPTSNKGNVGGHFDEGQTMFASSRLENSNIGGMFGYSSEDHSSARGYGNSFNPQFTQQTNQVNNTMFVLSCAPINGFNKLIHQDENLPQLSLVEQAHRFAEMNALFQVPAHLPSNDPLHIQQQIFDRNQLAEKQRRSDSMRSQREKLQSSIEDHKSRLDKGRQSPRRFPMDSKPSMQSPRAKLHSRQQQPDENVQTQQNSYDSFAQNHGDPFPPPNASSPTTFMNNNSVDSISSAVMTPGSALEGAAGNAITPGPVINPVRTPTSSPKRPKTISFEEFQQKADKINVDLKTLVRDIVHEEMIADGQAQHYTKRFQNKLLLSKQEPLVTKIEKAVGEKIQKLQKEVEDLKEQKVKGTGTKKKRNILRDSIDAGDESPWGDIAATLSVDGYDGKSLSSEINRSVEQALKRLLGGESPERLNSSAKAVTDDRYSSREKSSSGRVHSRINNAPESTIVDSVGFDGPPDTNFGAPLNQPSFTLSQTSTELAAVEPIHFEEPPPTKPKSKADRLLGISSDPKSGLPVNDNLTSTKNSGLFNSIGSLFSAKPGSGAPPPANSGQFGSSTRNVPSIHSPMMKPHVLGTILDEGNDDASEKKSLAGGSVKKTKKKELLRESFGATESSKNGASVHQSAATPAPPPMNPQLVADIASEEVNYRSLMSNLVSLADVKANIKKELKDWQTDFKSKYGREATVEDKMAINDRFIAHKMVSTQVQEAKDLVKASEDKLKELREKASNPQ